MQVVKTHNTCPAISVAQVTGRQTTYYLPCHLYGKGNSAHSKARL